MKVRVKQHWFAIVPIDEEGSKITQNAVFFQATRAKLLDIFYGEEAFGLLFDNVDSGGLLNKVIQAAPQERVCTYGATSKDELVNAIRRDVMNKTLAEAQVVLAY